MNVDQLLERRLRLFGPGNPLFYDEPLHLVRGEGVWLYDAQGRAYLDCYNNVPSVGHCHPRVVQAVAEQSARLNTHTRYLHEHILDYGERLLGHFDPSLDRLALTCTGSEANDLAMRIARAHTGADGFICTDATYHGNTTAVGQFSDLYVPVGGVGPHIRRVPWPDSYRPPPGVGPRRLARHYADAVAAAIESLRSQGMGLAGMILCPLFANEGLPTVPSGYLEQVARHVRAAGGLVICDEVQSGFGRTGRWWGHEGSGLLPDIVTLGKPMGAGYPLAGVVARGELIDGYRRREMYFNTFGGNPVACAAGLAVLDVLEQEDLPGNAARTGALVVKGLKMLQARFEGIGQVRGRGLFFAVDLVKDRDTREPDGALAQRVVNDMRQRDVLISRIGPQGNVLKVRPPLCFGPEHAARFLDALDASLRTLTG